MKRRTVLAATAASAAASVAGCLASNDEPNGTEASDDDPNESTDGAGGGGSDDDGASGGGDGTSDDGDDSDGGDGGSGIDGAEITGRSIRTTDRACGTQNASGASMTVEEGAIVVRGTLSASTPCHDAMLSDAIAQDRTLRIGVSLSQQDGVCQQCLGEISYEATVELTNPNGLDSVQVSHDGGGQYQFDVE